MIKHRFFSKGATVWLKYLAVIVIFMCLSNLIPVQAETQSVTQDPQKRVTGVVTDEKGEGVIGATVQVKGTSNGTATDINGRFSLDAVPESGILQVTFLGYNTQEISARGRNSFNIQLSESTQALEEVVVVGYGTMRKSDLTGSVSVVKSEDILARPQFSVLEGLRGKVAGLNIMSGTYNPLGIDGGAPRMVIRGLSSLNTDYTPLFVVDGVQMTDIQFVNPNDVESIEVLKDASATAIYGARGANGVILITTKRGNVGEGRTTVSYNGYISLNTMAKKLDLMNSAEFVEMEDIAFANLEKYAAGRTTLRDKGFYDEDTDTYGRWIPRRTDPLFFDANGNPLYDTDWQEETTRTGVSYSHQLAVQHQGPKASVGAFINFSNQEGIMLNNYAKRVNARMTFDAKPKKWLDVNTNLMVNYTWGNTIDDTGGGARRNILEMQPIIPVRFPDGRWGTQNYATQLDYNLEGMLNPVQEMTDATRTRIRTKVNGNLALVFHILDGLDLRTQMGVDYNHSTDRNYFPNDLLYISSPNGRASIGYRESMYWQEETYLSYNKQLNEKHRINAVLGLSWNEMTTFRFGTGDVSGFSTNTLLYNYLQAGTTPSAPTSSSSRWAMNSYFGRAGYTLMDKYLATATFRVDGSSRFGANNKYAFFPSAGLGWVINNEDFMKDINWLSNLKLRASYGRSGNQEIDLYQSLALISSSTTLLNGSRAVTGEPNRLANPDLKWEKTDQLDAGFDVRLFKKLNVEFSYYHKNTTDLLLDRPIPYETGFGTVFMNMGSVVNQGVDLLINSTNVQTKDFSWETSFSFNFNRNRITKLGENDEDIISGRVIHRVGEPIASFYTYKRLGTWSTAEAKEAADRNQSPGESKKTTDRFVYGSGMPDYSGSLINRFYYKNFDLIVDLQYVTGVQCFETYLGALADRAGVANGLKIMLTEGWREDRQNTMVQQIRHSGLSGQSSSDDDWWIADASYIRGNLIQLGYTFDRKMLQSQGMQNLRINFSVSNAFLIHSKEFRAYDPEGSDSTGRWGQNVFFYQYPRERTFTLGASVNF